VFSTPICYGILENVALSAPLRKANSTSLPSARFSPPCRPCQRSGTTTLSVANAYFWPGPLLVGRSNSNVFSLRGNRRFLRKGLNDRTQTQGCWCAENLSTRQVAGEKPC
jgi:hypothetical protein